MRWKNYLQNKYNSREIKTKKAYERNNNKQPKKKTKRRKFPIIYNLNICINIINLKQLAVLYIFIYSLSHQQFHYSCDRNFLKLWAYVLYMPEYTTHIYGNKTKITTIVTSMMTMATNLQGTKQTESERKERKKLEGKAQAE